MHFWPLKTTPSTVCYLFSAASKFESKNKNQGGKALTSTWIEHATLRFGIWCTTTVLRSQDVRLSKYWVCNLTTLICFSPSCAIIPSNMHASSGIRFFRNLSITIVSLPARVSGQFQRCPSISFFIAGSGPYLCSFFHLFNWVPAIQLL